MSHTIDWTTLPHASKVVSIGYGMSVTVHRINNIVITSGIFNNSAVVPANSSTSLAETMPLGYRPKDGWDTRGAAIVGSAPNKTTMGWAVYPTGAMDFWTGGVSIPAPSVITVTGIWETDDPWPV